MLIINTNLKKNILCIAIFLLVFCYFKPLRLSDLINTSNTDNLDILASSLNINNSYTNEYSDQDISQDDLLSIIAIINNYTYTRKFNTMFSDGSLHELGDYLIHIYTYKNNNQINNLSISDNNKISINNKSYSIKNSDNLIQEILEVLNF